MDKNCQKWDAMLKLLLFVHQHQHERNILSSLVKSGYTNIIDTILDVPHQTNDGDFRAPTQMSMATAYEALHVLEIEKLISLGVIPKGQNDYLYLDNTTLTKYGKEKLDEYRRQQSTCKDNI